MSVQFGRWNFQGQPPAPDYIDKVSAALAPYAPDSNESYVNSGLKILYRAFHTTKESYREKQPCISLSSAVITWDGRLDNRADLLNELGPSVIPRTERQMLSSQRTDVEIVAAAYETWGANCLGKLIGDWALSIWDPRERCVLLAIDPIGTRHLYYSFDDEQLTWSTILDPLVLFGGRTVEICEEYIAGWFSYFPAAHLTPYVGIHAVPPSCSVLLQPSKHGQHGVKAIVCKYWDFDPGKRILYRTDAEYEEHFRNALATAVQRRLRSDRPVIAELSGGMDSSSIVCMADLVIAGGQAHCPRLDTISWFDDSYDHVEPDSNELHWISKVEEKRNRPGFHINLRELKANDDHSQRHFTSEFDNDHFAATPTPNRPVSEHFSQYAAHMKSQGHRVVLAGIGGDEVTGGGVPTPRPELQNLLVRARFFTLARQLKAWAARMRTPRIPLLWQAARPFLARSVTGAGTPKHVRPAPWFYRGFIRQNHAALYGYPSRVKFFGPLPSFQENVTTLEVLRRTFVSLCLYPEFCRELRYPYLDRDLLEFIYAVPREQIVRVGQRRSLMKRSLVNIVPDELLSRKRKAFVRQEPEKDSSTEWPSLAETGRQIVGSSVGIIDPNRFWEALQKARRNEEVPIDSLRKTLTLESWLRHLTVQEVLRNPLPKRRTVILRPLRALAQRFEGQRGTLLSTLGIKKSPASAQPTVQLASSWKAKTTKERR